MSTDEFFFELTKFTRSKNIIWKNREGKLRLKSPTFNTWLDEEFCPVTFVYFNKTGKDEPCAYAGRIGEKMGLTHEDCYSILSSADNNSGVFRNQLLMACGLEENG